MRNVEASRRTLEALGLAALMALAACGESRNVADVRPMCERCHGGASGNAAPPTSVGGATATTDPKVGAHQAHLRAGRLRGPIACDECHVVPADMRAHEAGIAAVAAGSAQRVVFGPFAAKGGAGAAWAPDTLRCSNTYCHGATLNRGAANPSPSWIAAGPGHSEASCASASCHGLPPSSAGHASLSLTFPMTPGDPNPCAACHSQTVTATLDAAGFPGISVAGGKHIDGALTVDAIGGACTLCHGFPPATGAHPAHTQAAVAGYGDLRKTADALTTDAAQYAFGCGLCHPLDFAQHDRHFSEGIGAIVELAPAAPGTNGSLRGLASPGAAWDPATLKCSGTYCHSDGKVGPVGTSPAWNAPVGTLGCGGCHGNPPGYANGGAGTATANSHLGLMTDGYETGHFAGFPAIMHAVAGIDSSYHGAGGGRDSSPITCQACHFDTVDAANTTAQGFYYLDTTGSYDLGGSASFTIGGTTYGAFACTACHDGTPATGAGAAKPYYHVNGVRDVSFDRRDVLPATTPGLPAAPNTPTRPYWLTSTNDLAWVGAAVGASGGMDGTTPSFHLKAAVWTATDKTCTSVACHFNRSSAQWGEPLPSSTDNGACTLCHSK